MGFEHWRVLGKPSPLLPSLRKLLPPSATGPSASCLDSSRFILLQDPQSVLGGLPHWNLHDLALRRGRQCSLLCDSKCTMRAPHKHVGDWISGSRKRELSKKWSQQSGFHQPYNFSPQLSPFMFFWQFSIKCCTFIWTYILHVNIFPQRKKMVSPVFLGNGGGKSTFLGLSRYWEEVAWKLVTHQESILHWKIQTSTRTQCDFLWQNSNADPPVNRDENL